MPDAVHAVRFRTDPAGSDRPSLAERYRRVRSAGEVLNEPLTPEDCVVQTMADVSPTKWHLAHTTWFFETFVLERSIPGYKPVHPEYRVLFNSYYNQVGEQFARSRRGVLSRPSCDEVWNYRRAVDEQMLAILDGPDVGEFALADVVEIGLNHEQQHQELMLTDIKHVFACNPLRPVYRERRNAPAGNHAPTQPVNWLEFDGGLHSIGFDGGGFSFDNEGPAHDVFLRPFVLASRSTTNAEFLEFVNDGGYERPELWLSDGWDAVRREGWRSPLYWERVDGEWRQFTLSGLLPLQRDEPVCHISYFEADAFARWSDARLPTEAEWETAVADEPIAGNFVESMRCHPAEAPRKKGRLVQMFGDVWEWTASPYVAYPGYRPSPGALGEYNGKFMCNQFVLRGGSCATPADHIRRTYRNFFQPEKRWQFTGVRLAKDV